MVLRYALHVLLLLCFAISLHAQTPGPSSGEITVRLMQALDSSQNPRGTTQATVTKSTNPDVTSGARAIVQLVPDSSGFSVQLTRLALNGQIVHTASSGAVLAGLSKTSLGIHLGARPQPVASGSRVFLPANTEVRFTLTAPPAEAVRTSPPTVQATPPPAQPSIANWSAPVGNLTTKDVAAACTTQDAAHQALCYGVLMMFYDRSQADADSTTYSPSFCIPATTTIGGLRDAFLDDALKKRPDQTESPISLFFLQTWDNAFPCPKAPAKKRTPAKKKPS